MKPVKVLGASLLLLMSGQAGAAMVDVYISGNISLEAEVSRNPELSQSVVDSLLGLLPDGAGLAGHFVVDTATADASSDPGIGDYQGAVTQASIRVNGFEFPLDSGFCNPDFDCKLRVQNDYFVTSSGALDLIGMSSPILQSLELGAAVSTQSGVVPGVDTGTSFIPLDPVISGFLMMFGGGVDVVDSEAMFDPLTAIFNDSGFSIALSNIWAPGSGSTEQTRFDFRVDNLQISDTPPAVVPLPAAAWLFGSALIGLAGFSRRGSWIRRFLRRQDR